MIPIPRNGVYWGVKNEFPVDTGNFWIDFLDDEKIWFQSEEQAVVSIWLMGFSYQQIDGLLPYFKHAINVRNFIFPRNVAGSNALRRRLQVDRPRQLVDSEYVSIVDEIGLPNGRINKIVYIKYMDWIDGKVS
jgi:hypothetical protein